MQPSSNNEEAKNMIIIKYYLAYLYTKTEPNKKIKHRRIWEKNPREN